MVKGAVRAAGALDAQRIPAQHRIEQAHTALMRDVGFDPGALEPHNVISTARRALSR